VKAVGEFSLRSKLAATVAAVALAIAVGFVDYLTGRELVVSAFYLLPTLLVAWVAGRWSGLVVGTLCTCVVPQRPAQRSGLSTSADSSVECHDAAGFLCCRSLAADRISPFTLSTGENRRAPNGCSASGSRREKRLENVRRTLGLHVGHRVAEQILARDPGLGGTEQQVTVMFVDIRSFTARAANLKPHEAMSFLNRFLHAMVEVVEIEHGGMINKFLGDGFMALFGVDSAQHNHADKALAAGRDLERRLERLNSDLVRCGEEAIRIGIGINTGRIVVGSIGSPERMEFTVIGNPVNIAARIEALNKTVGTTLLLSRATRDALRRPILLRALPRQAVEGLEHPLEVFTLDHAWT
jgi:class 3 adenylate cyclase